MGDPPSSTGMSHITLIYPAGKVAESTLIRFRGADGTSAKSTESSFDKIDSPAMLTEEYLKV